MGFVLYMFGMVVVFCTLFVLGRGLIHYYNAKLGEKKFNPVDRLPDVLMVFVFIIFSPLALFQLICGLVAKLNNHSNDVVN